MKTINEITSDTHVLVTKDLAWARPQKNDIVQINFNKTFGIIVNVFEAPSARKGKVLEVETFDERPNSSMPFETEVTLLYMSKENFVNAMEARSISLQAWLDL